MVCNPVFINGPAYESVKSTISETFETDVLQNTAMSSTFAHQPCCKVFQHVTVTQQ